jgi:hypothetical protein
MPHRARAAATPIVLLLLVAVVAHWTASQVHGRLIQLGEHLWPGYALELRRGDEAAPPDAAAPAADDALLGELLGEVAPTAAPEPAVAPQAAPLTTSQRAFRAVDQGMASFVAWGTSQFKPALVLLILVCGTVATAVRGHIALGSPQSQVEDRLSAGAQLVGNGLLVASAVALHRSNEASGASIVQGWLPLLWAIGFAAMGVLNLLHIARPDPALPAGGSPGRAILAVPLYTSMAVLSGAWFLLGEGYPAGLAVYLDKLTEHAQLYIFVGLYVGID